MRILVVEDEIKLANAIKRALEIKSYAVDVCYNGSDGLDLALGENYDAIILEVMLPGTDGVTVCKRIREEGKKTQILMLTARGEVKDKVLGLDSGADDYMVKPFSLEELFARLRVMLRRNTESQTTILAIADLSLDPVGYKVKRGDTEIALSSKEYAILEFLMRNPNMILSREKIIHHVWDYDANILPSTIEVHMKHIRDKIDKGFKKKLIHTARGFGYEIKVEDK